MQQALARLEQPVKRVQVLDEEVTLAVKSWGQEGESQVLEAFQAGMGGEALVEALAFEVRRRGAGAAKVLGEGLKRLTQAGIKQQELEGVLVSMGRALMEMAYSFGLLMPKKEEDLGGGSDQ